MSTESVNSIPKEPDSSTPAIRWERPIRFVGMLGLAVAACLMPWVFGRLFAMGPLLAGEQRGLWVGAVVTAAVSALLVWRSERIRPAWAALALGVLLLVGLELSARACVNIFARGHRPRLAWLANRTYPQFIQIQGHPFLQYTGNSRVRGLFNNYGFSGPDFQLEKKPGVLRVVCLGGSTTEYNWPPQMETLLKDNAARQGRDLRFEVLNFGKVGYTSLHDMVNFTVNAIEFSPDYVVVHSGWNDTVSRNWPQPVRRDYSDILKPFEIPPIPDKWPLRLSVIYRGTLALLIPRNREPQWVDIRNTLEIEPKTERKFDNPDQELLPFRHNIVKIVQFARLRGVRVVLATIPHSTDPNVPSAEEARHLDQCNAIVREIYRENPDGVLLVDLDKDLTGKNYLYRDLAHMGPQGDAEKAAAVARAILADASQRSSR